MTEEVRLVVWDLDETFWRGTLSEEGITEYSAANHDIVVTLAQRGIVSSICSKNDLEQVKQVLVERGLWEYFVFPSIDWTPKAPRLRALIDAVQLRPESILFIDDNPGNRGEAKALIPGLMVEDETIVPSLLDDRRFRGKRDSALDRLKAYKVLEAKAVDRSRHQADVDGFLRASEIAVTIIYEIDDHIDRIVEILNRTNQLNFTKRRLAEDKAHAVAELRDQLDTSFARRAGVVQVADRYGDYGIVGFWALEGYGTDLRLLHFAFSCRILGMGVEQWVYDKLGAPALDIVGTVASKLDFVPDWINASHATSGGLDADRRRSTFRSVYLRGACELEILKHFFSFASERVDSEFVFMRGVLTVWRSHIVSMFPQDAMRPPDACAALERLGFSLQDFGSALASNDSVGPDSREPGLSGTDLVVISPSGDATVPLYEHRRFGFLVPIHEHGLGDFTRLSDAEVEAYAHRWNLCAESRAALQALKADLARDYRFVGPEQIDLGPYYARAIDRIPPKTLLVFLLPATGDAAGQDIAQHKVNDTIRAVARRWSNVRCVEVADHIGSTKRILDPSRFHLDREVYLSIFKEISALHAAWWNENAAASPKPLREPDGRPVRVSAWSALRRAWNRLKEPPR